MGQKKTKCGLPYEHSWHPYQHVEKAQSPDEVNNVMIQTCNGKFLANEE